MQKILNFQGFIQSLEYQPCMCEPLKEIDLHDFNINTAPRYGLIKAGNTEVSYSKWVSPKRTRSYPFARLYNTYGLSKKITVIPIIKDEGLDGDLDKIQYSTISWMSLFNVYIVIAYYERASKNYKKGQEKKDKLTNQQFNHEFVLSQIQEILHFQKDAACWNDKLFEDRFVEVFERALDSYKYISTTTGVIIHSQTRMEGYLDSVRREYEKFKTISLKGSQSASKREAATSHKLEYLVDGLKATFSIEDYLGGLYYLTPDEIHHSEGKYIIQESKNASASSFPKLDDIQDGLFKLILFSNLRELKLNEIPVDFVSKLKLTGKNIQGTLCLPSQESDIDLFIRNNYSSLSSKNRKIIKRLNLEAINNNNLKIEISSNNL